MTFSNLFYPLLGGALIGVAAVFLMLADGKIAGISGMLGGLFRADIRENTWRVAFLAGLVMGGVVMKAAGVLVFQPLANRSVAALILAGVLVGLGTQLGSGCTSGHGVCGIGRGSMRSLIATLTFITTGALSIILIRHLAGGQL